MARPLVWRRLAPVIFLGVLAGGCSRATAPLVRERSSAVALTGGPNTSMVYLARAGNRLIAIDLGWWGSDRAVRAALKQLDASAGDVTDVFLTHSHRDHVGAWRLLRASRFHVADAERPLLVGARDHRGWIPRLAERLKPSGLPGARDIEVSGFAKDTAFIFGTDTLHAFLVPGHTTGSTVYLFRGVLFLGDAATYTPWGGFAPAKRGFSDDAKEAETNLSSLWKRLPAGSTRYVCTAHARCRSFSPEFLRDIGA